MAILCILKGRPGYQLHIYPSIVCNCFISFMGMGGRICWSQSQLSLGKGRVHPWTSHQLIAGPSLMAEATMQGVSCASGAIWGSVSCSRTLRHATQPRAGIWTSDFPITSQVALPTELQPAPTYMFDEEKKKMLSHLLMSCCWWRRWYM